MYNVRVYLVWELPGTRESDMFVYLVRGVQVHVAGRCSHFLVKVSVSVVSSALHCICAVSLEAKGAWVNKWVSCF